jgi:hypothetical protein
MTLTIRNPSLFLAAAKASHGLIVVSKDSHLKRNGEVLIGFADILLRLCEIEAQTEGTQTLVWLLDEGALDFSDEDARKKWVNLQDLRARFAAIKSFSVKDTQWDGLWEWLIKRAAIVINRKYIKGDRLAPFLLRRVPLEWEDSPAYHRLTKYDLSPSYGVFVKPSEKKIMTIIGVANSPYGTCQRVMPEIHASVESEMLTIFAAARIFLRIQHSVSGNAYLDNKHALTSFTGSGLVFGTVPEFLDKY